MVSFLISSKGFNDIQADQKDCIGFANRLIKNGFTTSNPKNFFIDRYERSYQKEISDFIKTIKGEVIEYATVDDGLHALKSGLAANKSLLKNKPVLV